MWFLNKILLFALILVVVYLVWLFAFTDDVKKIWDEVWLKSFNEIMLNLKERVQKLSDIDPNETMKNIWSWTTEILDSATNSLKDLKTKVDTIRSWAKEMENTYNEVKNQVQATAETLDKARTDLQNITDSVQNVTNLLN